MSDRWTTPPLNHMTARAQQIALEWYGLGYQHGLAAAHDQAQRDAFEFLRAVGDVARSAVRGEPLADRFDALGEHRRAERQRALLRQRGITNEDGLPLPNGGEAA